MTDFARATKGPCTILRGTEPLSQRRSQRERRRKTQAEKNNNDIAPLASPHGVASRHRLQTRERWNKRVISPAHPADLPSFAGGASLAQALTPARHRASVAAPITARAHKVWLLPTASHRGTDCKHAHAGCMTDFARAKKGPCTILRGTEPLSLRRSQLGLAFPPQGRIAAHTANTNAL